MRCCLVKTAIDSYFCFLRIRVPGRWPNMCRYVHFLFVLARQLALLPWVTNRLSIARCNLTFNSVRTTTSVAITPLDIILLSKQFTPELWNPHGDRHQKKISTSKTNFRRIKKKFSVHQKNIKTSRKEGSKEARKKE